MIKSTDLITASAIAPAASHMARDALHLCVDEQLGGRNGANRTLSLYKEFRTHASQDWSGQWLAEAKKLFDPAPEHIATPFSHPTPQAAIDFVKQMIDSPSTTINEPKTIQWRGLRCAPHAQKQASL